MEYDLIKVNEFPEQDFVDTGNSWFVIAGPDGLARKISDLNLRQFLLATGEGSQVINPGVLVINSSTEATLTGAKWLHTGGVFEYTGTIPIPASPSEPNNRFDIVTFGNSATPVVKSGTAEPEPVVPNPDTGFVLGHTIYRPYTGGGIVIPTNPQSYSTAVVAGRFGEYAPIWRQTLTANNYYGFKISFLSWSSEFGAFGQHPTNGFVLVSFVTGTSSTQVDPNRVIVRSMDISVDNGDFMLVQETANRVALFAKKKSYLGNMTFQWVLPFHHTVLPTSLVNNGAYAPLPGGASYPSYNGRDYVSSTMPVTFDLPRQYGFDTPITGNITFQTSLGDAVPPRVDTNVMVKVLHNSATEPTVTAPANVEVRKEGGTYAPNVDNIYYMIPHKNAAGRIISVSYTITQDT